MKKVDFIILIIYIVSLVVLYFFWGCRLDWIVTTVGAIIAILASVAAHMQNKKIKELEEQKKENQ